MLLDHDNELPSRNRDGLKRNKGKRLPKADPSSKKPEIDSPNPTTTTPSAFSISAVEISCPLNKSCWPRNTKIAVVPEIEGY